MLIIYIFCYCSYRALRLGMPYFLYLVTTAWEKRGVVLKKINRKSLKEVITYLSGLSIDLVWSSSVENNPISNIYFTDHQLATATATTNTQLVGYQNTMNKSLIAWTPCQRHFPPLLGQADDQKPPIRSPRLASPLSIAAINLASSRRLQCLGGSSFRPESINKRWQSPICNICLSASPLRSVKQRQC